MVITIRIEDSDAEKLKAIAESIGASRNFIIREAISNFISQFERAKIDKAFEGMAKDENYQRVTDELLCDFEYADAEAGKLLA